MIFKRKKRREDVEKTKIHDKNLISHVSAEYRKNKTIAKICILAALILFGLSTVLYGINAKNAIYADYKNKYEVLSNKNAELEEEIKDLKEQLKDKEEMISAKNEVIDKIQTNYNTLNKQIDRLIKAIQN